MGWVNLGDFSRRHEKGSIGIIIFYVRCTIFHEPEPFSQRLQSNILKPYIQNNSDYLALVFIFFIFTTLIILCVYPLEKSQNKLFLWRPQWINLIVFSPNEVQNGIRECPAGTRRKVSIQYQLWNDPVHVPHRTYCCIVRCPQPWS